MDILIPNVAGIDVHKEELVITTLQGEAGQKIKVEQFSCSTFTGDLRLCAKKMVSDGIKHVAMESSGIFWKPVYNVFHAEGLIVTLGNATHMKNVPGRKTDMKDSHWIAYLHRHGFIRPSFIPEEEFQDLRLLTRHRVTLLQEKTRIKNRVQKILEDGNVKLSSVINDVFGIGGRAVLDKIAEGITDAKELENALKTNIKRKEDLEKSLVNCLRSVHTFLIKNLLSDVDFVDGKILEIDAKINALFTPHEDIITRLCEIPGISRTAATQILSETSNDLSSFKDDRHFAAWAGVAPGNNESAKKNENREQDMETQH
jgi:transposase